jgi:hypothetical protein
LVEVRNRRTGETALYQVEAFRAADAGELAVLMAYREHEDWRSIVATDIRPVPARKVVSA